MIQLFSDLNENNGLTIILVTHDQAVARNAKRIIVLHDGGIIEDTTDLRQAMQSLNSAEDLYLPD